MQNSIVFRHLLNQLSIKDTQTTLLYLYKCVCVRARMSILHIPEVREYCEWETFNASCSSSTKGDVIATHEDHVIVIRNARYGRMHVGRCVTQSYGNIGCGADVTAELSRACSGRVRCSVAVISLYGRRSCPKDFTSYLEASYECIRGAFRLETIGQGRAYHTRQTC